MKRLNPVSVFLSLALLFLAGCGGSGGYTQGPAQQPPGTLDETAGPPSPGTPPAPQNLRPVKVGILLPLTGKDQQLGQSMLKAAQMALFDVGYEGFELIPRDTKGTSSGAQDAARSAIAEGAELLLGPIFSDEVQAVRSIASGARINVVAFSTDWKQAGGNTFIMGFMPFDQIERVAQFAAAQNIRRAGIIAPSTDYGQIAMDAFLQAGQRYGIQTTDTQRFNPQTKEINATIRGFTHFDERHRPGQPVNANMPYDAVFLPAGGDSAKIVANVMTQYDATPNRVRRLGTGLFDDPSLTQEAGFEGAWFAAPNPSARQAFERRFLQSYGYSAPRLTTLAYDATALAAVLAQRGLSSPANAPAYDKNSLMNPNGFAGIDGIFRFRPDGTAERGLAVLEVRRGSMIVVDEAPKTFQSNY